MYHVIKVTEMGLTLIEPVSFFDSIRNIVIHNAIHTPRPVTSFGHQVGEEFSERGPIFLNYVEYF